mgnify:CR=1 FL=1
MYMGGRLSLAHSYTSLIRWCLSFTSYSYRVMKHLLLAALLAVGAAAPAAAQTSRFRWQRSIETPQGREQARQMVRCRTGGYLVCGRINDSITTIPSTYVVKVDEQGQKVWERRIDPDPSHSHQGVSIAENRSGQLLVATLAGDFTNDIDTRLDLLSPTGQPIWHRFYDSPLTDYIEGLKLGNDGNFVGIAKLLGAQSVFKMDSTGRFIWQRAVPYDSTNAGSIMDILPLQNGDGYLVKNSLYSTAPPYYLGRLVNLDEAGAYLFDKATMRNSLHVYRSVLATNGEPIYAHDWVSRLSVQADTLWTKYYPAFGGARSLTVLSDDNTLLLGHRYFGPYPDITLAKISPNGQLLIDTVLYRIGTYEDPVDVVEDPQGNYVICANTDIGLNGTPAIVLLKLRPWTQTLGLPDTDTTLLRHITLYPNPAHEWVRLRSSAPMHGQCALRDALGRVVRSFSLDATAADAPLSLADLPAGLYLLTYLEHAGVATRTWRIQKQ